MQVSKTSGQTTTKGPLSFAWIPSTEIEGTLSECHSWYKVLIWRSTWVCTLLISPSLDWSYLLVIIKGRRSEWPRGLRRGLRPLACKDFGFECRRGHGRLSLVSVVCCLVEVCTSGWSLVQRSPTECGVSECDREASIMRGPWPHQGLLRHGKTKFNEYIVNAHSPPPPHTYTQM